MFYGNFQKFKGKGQRTDGKACKNVKKEKVRQKIIENPEPWKEKLVGGVRVIIKRRRNGKK